MPSIPATETADRTPVLAVDDYSLAYRTRDGILPALRQVGLRVDRGEVLGLVGESGSGKSSLALAIMRHLPGNALETSGRIQLTGEDLMGASDRRMDGLRGRRIGMVFQDPSTSLNPIMTLGDQIIEVLRRHRGVGSQAARVEAACMFERVGLQDPKGMMRRYPHEVSGGEKQRVVIASTFACQPECILFDEPTTALDVITARQILDLLQDLQQETGVASLYISHDLALVAAIADRVAVIHRGAIVEQGTAAQIFRRPEAPYTRSLIDSVPRPEQRLVRNERAIEDPPIVQVHDLSVHYQRRSLFDFIFPQPSVLGARAVSFTVRPGQIVGIVGESGSGKSTIAKALVGLNPFEGEIDFAGHRFRSATTLSSAYRQAVQIVFQHPDASLNPRHTIEEIIARPLRRYRMRERGRPRDVVRELLADVRLPADYARRYPHQLSGGEKQRVAIARAFASRPRLVICDEITSSLDVSVQASIIRLLLELRERHGTAYLFITHDLNLVQQIAHHVIVMYRGDLVEAVDLAQLRAGPRHAYTRALLDAIPSPVSTF